MAIQVPPMWTLPQQRLHLPDMPVPLKLRPLQLLVVLLVQTNAVMDAAFLNAQNTVTNLVHTIGTDAHITAGTDQFLLTQCTLSSRWFKQRCNALVLDEVHDECLDFHYNTALWHHRMTLPSSTLHCPVLALLTAQMTPDLMHDVGKGDKRIFDTAVREHIQFCECNMKCTAYKYPWQMCFFWENNRASLPFGPIGMPPCAELQFCKTLQTLQSLTDRKTFLTCITNNCFADFRRLSGMQCRIPSVMLRWPNGIGWSCPTPCF